MFLRPFLILDHTEKQHGRHMTYFVVCGLVADIAAFKTAIQNYIDNKYVIANLLADLTDPMKLVRIPAAKLTEVIEIEHGGNEQLFDIPSHYRLAVGPAPAYVPIGHETIRYANWDADFGFVAVWESPTTISTAVATSGFTAGINQWTVRGDTRKPEEIFTWGFRPRRLSFLEEQCLADPAQDGAIKKCKKLPNAKCKIDGAEIADHLSTSDSCWWVSTSIAASVSLKFSNYLYVSIAREALDINKMSGGVNYEGEILVNGGVPSEDILLGVKFASATPNLCGKKAGSEDAKYSSCNTIEEVHYNNAFAWPEGGGGTANIAAAVLELLKY